MFVSCVTSDGPRFVTKKEEKPIAAPWTTWLPRLYKAFSTT